MPGKRRLCVCMVCGVRVGVRAHVCARVAHVLCVVCAMCIHVCEHGDVHVMHVCTRVTHAHGGVCTCFCMCATDLGGGGEEWLRTVSHVLLRMSGLCLHGDPWTLARGMTLASHTACFNGQLSSESGLHAQLFLEMPAPPLLRAGNIRALGDLVGAGYGPNSGWL